MRLVVLGSGTGTPHPSRSSSGYWLELGGVKILLDCSPAIGHRMAAANLRWHDLDAIWISHFHLDHFGGLAPFLAGTKYAAEMHDRKKPLFVYGPNGIKDRLLSIDDSGNYRLLQQRFPIEIIEVESEKMFHIAGIVDAAAFKTPHTHESLAIYLRSGGRSLFYTSDTAFDPALGTFARGVDILLIESSFPSDKPAPKHLELAEAMFIIHKARPQNAILTHLYPEWDKVDADHLIKNFTPSCNVQRAYDGMEINID